MKKLPYKFHAPLTALIMLPSMMLGMPALMTYRNLPEGAEFFDMWCKLVSTIVPTALMLIVVLVPLVRLSVTKVLVDKPEKSAKIN